VCRSPKLIAACRVLHRLFLPRHPPCALSSLTIEFTRTQQSDNLCYIETSTVDISPRLCSTTCLRKLPEDMLLSLVVIYLPNLFSCQKSLSETYYYVLAIAPLGGSSIPAQGSISTYRGDSTSSRHRLLKLLPRWNWWS
jgi:hypothetical protein